jgi:hypothetical protein
MLADTRFANKYLLTGLMSAKCIAYLTICKTYSAVCSVTLVLYPVSTDASLNKYKYVGSVPHMLNYNMVVYFGSH